MADGTAFPPVLGDEVEHYWLVQRMAKATGVDLVQAMDAGLSSIEHLDYAFRAGSKVEEAVVADFAAGRIDRAEASRRLDAGFDRETAMAVYRDIVGRIGEDHARVFTVHQ